MRVQDDGDHLFWKGKAALRSIVSLGRKVQAETLLSHSALRTARLRPQPVRVGYITVKQAAQDLRVALKERVLLLSPHPGCYIYCKNTDTDWIRALWPLHKRGSLDVMMLLPFDPHPITPLSLCLRSFFSSSSFSLFHLGTFNNLQEIRHIKIFKKQ